VNNKVNKIRNPDFSVGKSNPSGWTWHATAKSAVWQKLDSSDSADNTGVLISTRHKKGSAGWCQTLICKPGEFYRIEARVSCDLSADDVHSGLRLSVQPLADNKPVRVRRCTPGLHRVDRPVTIRADYQAPDDVRRLRVSIGIVDAKGTAQIHEVRYIQILEPDTVSNPLAIPAPSYTAEIPCKVSSVCICSESADDRKITYLLKSYFDHRKVKTLHPKKLKSSYSDTNALLLPDPVLPPSIRSIKSLVRLANDRVVVVSTQAFAKLAGTAVSLKRIEQPDDPIHAKIMYANYASCGFALNDIIAYAWPGKKDGSFVQYQFRKTAAFKEFCNKHGLVTFLASMCDKDSTSDPTISLYKETPGGKLFILDIDPVEVKGSTAGEPVLAMHLLLSILGQIQNRLGQYTFPVRKEAEFRDIIREMSNRFDEFVVHDEDVPVDEVKEQLVTIGREDQSFGLPLTSKPVILLRSGLSSGDVESVYGVLYWIKQLLRMPPYVCPYADQLASQFRLAWVPQLASWNARDGFQRLSRSPDHPVSIECDGADIATMIDVVSCPVNQVRVVLPQTGGSYQTYFRWLGSIFNTFGPGQYFAYEVENGEAFNDRRKYSWHHLKNELQIVADAKSFDSEDYQEVMSTGGQVCRIEIPGNDADFTAHSIRRTDITATVLEQVIGLQFGIIAVNRSRSTIRYDGFAPIKSGQALIVDRNEPMLRSHAPKVG